MGRRSSWDLMVIVVILLLIAMDVGKVVKFTGFKADKPREG
jgi:hypothetical protein